MKKNLKEWVISSAATIIIVAIQCVIAIHFPWLRNSLFIPFCGYVVCGIAGAFIVDRFKPEWMGQYGRFVLKTTASYGSAIMVIKIIVVILR